MSACWCRVRAHSQDLESALHYSLRHEVALHQTISAPALAALRTYLRALALVCAERA